MMVKRIISLTAMSILSCLLFSSITFATLPKADKIIVIKGKRILILLKDSEIIKTYRIALGKSPDGRKTQAGDQKTPEGNYIITSRNQHSKYYKAINISYPNESDIQNARRLGVSPGNSIAIHGLPKELEDIDKFHRRMDWTDGCIAVTNHEIDEIWQLVSDGTPIEIKP
jgi:murein L,D-transpeptidase YafK